MPVEDEIGHRPLQLGLPLAELPAFLGLAQAESGVRLSGLHLPQGAENFLFGVILPWHSRGLLSGVHEAPEAKDSNSIPISFREACQGA